MNGEENEAINLNFDTMTIDHSVNMKVGKNISSPIIRGSVTGDIVNEVYKLIKQIFEY